MKSKILPWLVPTAALIAAALLLVREYHSRGATIVLYARSNPGLEPEISELRFRGVRCGLVSEVRLEPEDRRVRIEIDLERWAEHLARAGSTFWVVAPELKVGQIRGLDALRSGTYVTVAPGDGDEQLEFEMLGEAPTVPVERPGQRYHVYAKRSHGIKAGAPVYYRGVTIGTVATMDLRGKATAVRLDLHIDRRYTALIRKETKFWPVVALRADIGLLGAEIETGTLESFWSGGVELATPPDSPPIDTDTVFWLRPEHEAEWLEWEPDIALPPAS